jgi:hypothetical protein
MQTNKRLFSTLLLSFFSALAFAQTGFWNDFSNSDVSSWKSTTTNAYKPTVTNQQLQIVAATSGFSNLEYTFPSQNISTNKRIKLKIVSPSNFTLRIDLKDATGKFTSTQAVTSSVTQGATLKRYVLDFTNAINASGVDATKIVQASIFFNAGGNFNGTVIFDDFVIGDSVKQELPTPGAVLINQVGYEKTGPKSGLLQTTSAFTDTLSFVLTNSTGSVVYKAKLGEQIQVGGWQNRFFRKADFGSFQQEGKFKLKIGNKTSSEFEIGQDLLFKKTAASVIDFFKGMRSVNTMDKTLSFYGSRNDVVDVSGGWFDASGDPGKHMSHLSYANYFNPQQIPFVAWSLLKSYEWSQAQFGTKGADVLAEAAFGADYLVRNTDKDGYLYIAIFDDWGGAPFSREICEWGIPGFNSGRTANYQAAMREGAGISIAALAKASKTNLTGGAFTPTVYLQKAETLYAHLKSPGTGYATKNLEYCNDHTENLIDFYCGLLAATELYKATSKPVYLADAKSYAQKLLKQQTSAGWLASDVAKNRPNYHAADEGLSVLALNEFSMIPTAPQDSIKRFISNSIKWQYSLTHEVANPFWYPRQYFKPFTTSLQAAQKAFFIPHNNETGYWWQGENARLASLSTAWIVGNKKLKPSYLVGTDSIATASYATLDWILGKNPFDVSFMTGFGYNQYPPYNGKTNIVGGICNGITSDVDTEKDIAWMPYDNSNATGDAWQNWRWVEQWIPHNAWYLLAISALSNNINNPSNDCNGQLGGEAFVDSCKICAGGTTGISPILDKSKCLSTSILSDETSKQAQLYPNPAHGLVQLNLTGVANSFSYKIVNMAGVELLQGQSNHPQTSIDISRLSEGIYNVVTTYDNRVEMLKFAVTR